VDRRDLDYSWENGSKEDLFCGGLIGGLKCDSPPKDGTKGRSPGTVGVSLTNEEKL